MSQRYEITGCSTDVFRLADVQAALRKVGATRVSARNAFGWRNQPQVATFRADSEDEASALADSARALLPYAYRA